MPAPDDILRKNIEDALSRHTNFAVRLEVLLKQLVVESKLDCHEVASRTKSFESAHEKSIKKGYVDVQRELTDITGLRIVTFYEEDVAKAVKMVRAEFVVDELNSADVREKYDDDAFGYQSVHLVCKLGNARANLGEWRALAGLSFEVQVRSVLQHAWASVSHKLAYKRPGQAPKNVSRRLSRLSALLELADEEFSWIRKDVKSATKDYAKKVSQGNLQVPLNLDSLVSYVKQDQFVDRWVAIGKDAGWLPPHEGHFTGDTQRLLAVLQALGVKDMARFAALETEAESSRAQLRRLGELATRAKRPILAVADDVLALAIATTKWQDLPTDFTFGDFVPQIKVAYKKFVEEQDASH